MKDLTKQNQVLENPGIQHSNTLNTTEVGEDTLLTNRSLEPVLDKTGTVYSTQNNVQVSDISRVKDSTDLMEVDWNYKNTTSKPFLQQHANWASSVSAGTHLIEYKFPNDYFSSNHVLKTIGNTFLSMRGDLHFIVTVQGSPVLSGALIIHPVYKLNNNITIHPTNGVHSWFFRQHAILDVSDNSSTVDLVVPYRYYRNGVDPFDEITSVFVTVLVPLQGISNVSITTTAYLENQEFKFLRPIESQVRKTQGLVDVTTINNNLSDIVNATLPLNITGDEFNISGMDDVGLTTNPSSYIVKFNSLNNAENPHYIDKMSLSPKTISCSTMDTFNTKIDEMSLHHIMCERDHYLTSGTIKTTVNPADAIFNLPLMPTIPLFRNNETVNTMSYIADTFKFWRGGLRFKIKFFMNRFQSMKFYLGLFYKAVSPTPFTDFSSSHGVVFDIGGNTREIEVEIPYNSETAWLHVLRKTIDITATYPGDSKQWYDYMLGSLTLYALSPLVSPDNTHIDYTITMSGADDFELANYCTTTQVSQGILKMSKDSIRTPDNITDVVTSMKDFYCKWQEIVSNGFLEITKPTSYISFQPSEILTTRGQHITGAGGSPTADTEIFRTKVDTILDKTAMYGAYRGGIKVRITVNVLPLLENFDFNNAVVSDILSKYFKPVCMYFNSDVYNVGPAEILQFVDNVAYQKTGASGVLTPYLITPINNTTMIMNQPLVYEIEVPYQRNTKYFEIGSDDSLDYGVIIFGFTQKYPDPEGGPKIGFNYTIQCKIADDGRFGVLNYGGFDTKNYTNFSLVGK